jgi:hypothetical protein
MVKNELTFDEALSFIKSQRSIAQPNSSFEAELRAFDPTTVILMNGFTTSKSSSSNSLSSNASVQAGPAPFAPLSISETILATFTDSTPEGEKEDKSGEGIRATAASSSSSSSSSISSTSACPVAPSAASVALSIPQDSEGLADAATAASSSSSKSTIIVGPSAPPTAPIAMEEPKDSQGTADAATRETKAKEITVLEPTTETGASSSTDISNSNSISRKRSNNDVFQGQSIAKKANLPPPPPPIPPSLSQS